MTPLRRFASSPQGDKHQWPGKAGSKVFIDKATSSLHPC
jgi:hypothetical protein